MPRSSTRVRVVYLVILVPALVVTLLGMLLLWPHDAPARGTIDPVADTAGKVRGTVVSAPVDLVVPMRVDGSDEIVDVSIPPEQLAAGIGPGDRLVTLHLPYLEGHGAQHVFMDFERSASVGVLAVAYVVVVLLVARWRGLAAIVGLLVSFGVVVTFTLPALLAGQHAVGVVLVTASAVMFVVLFLAHGFSVRTAAALLGTLVGLALTTVLAGWAVDAANVLGLGEDYARILPAYAPAVDMRGIALCGIVLAGLGVLNDVTITQASAVWELRAASPGASRRELFTRGMRIGRDHIASTVYTIAFAYLGGALPMLLVVYLVSMTLGESLTSGEIAHEVVRTLVGSIGLVLAIPLTTALAAATVGTLDGAGEVVDEDVDRAGAPSGA